jgi:hypothetical protein
MNYNSLDPEGLPPLESAPFEPPKRFLTSSLAFTEGTGKEGTTASKKEESTSTGPTGSPSMVSSAAPKTTKPPKPSSSSTEPLFPMSDWSEPSLRKFASYFKEHYEDFRKGVIELRLTVDTLSALNAMVQFHRKAMDDDGNGSGGKKGGGGSPVAFKKEKKSIFSMFRSKKEVSDEDALSIISALVADTPCLALSPPRAAVEKYLQEREALAASPSIEVEGSTDSKSPGIRYDATIDLSAFSSLRRVSIHSLRVLAVRGARNIVEVRLIRATLVVPVQMLVLTDETPIPGPDGPGLDSTVVMEEQGQPKVLKVEDPRSESPQHDLRGRSPTAIILPTVAGDLPTQASVDGIADGRAPEVGSAVESGVAQPGVPTLLSPDAPMPGQLIHKTCTATWKAFEALETLRCNGCAPPLYTISAEGVARLATTLQRLELVGSISGPTFIFLRLQDVPHCWEELKIVDFSRNRLTRLDSSWELLKGLTTLDLSENSLRGLHSCLYLLEHLHTVNLRGNRIADLAAVVPCIPRVRHLDLSRNYIVSAQLLSQLPELQTVVLNTNNLQYWSDLTHIAQHCIRLLSVTFIDNPMCSLVYKGDIVKLGYVIFANRKGIRINGQEPTPWSVQQQLALAKKYQQVFEAKPENLTREPSSPSRGRQSEAGGISFAGSELRTPTKSAVGFEDGPAGGGFPRVAFSERGAPSVMELASQSARHRSPHSRYGGAPSNASSRGHSHSHSHRHRSRSRDREREKDRDRSDAMSVGASSFRPSLLGGRSQQLGGSDDEVEEGGGGVSEYGGRSTVRSSSHSHRHHRHHHHHRDESPHSKRSHSRSRKSRKEEEEVYSEPEHEAKEDYLALREKYGDRWLQEYRERVSPRGGGDDIFSKVAYQKHTSKKQLLDSPLRSNRHRRGKSGKKRRDESSQSDTENSDDGAAELLDIPTPSEDSGSLNTPHVPLILPASLPPAPPPPKLTLDPLQGDELNRYLKPALSKFCHQLLGVDTRVWTAMFPGEGFRAVYPFGAWMRIFAVQSEARTIQSILEEYGNVDSNEFPLHQYQHQNVWEISVQGGRTIPEIWFNETDQLPFIKPMRYNNHWLIRIDRFELEGKVGFCVRQKHIKDIRDGQSFSKRPMLASYHYCPTARGDAMKAPVFENVFIAGEPGCTTPGAITLTRGQHMELMSTVSFATPPETLAGFVFPSAQAASEFIQKLNRKFSDFRNPQYVADPLDWPLYTVEELIVDLPFLQSTKVEFGIDAAVEEGDGERNKAVLATDQGESGVPRPASSQGSTPTAAAARSQKVLTGNAATPTKPPSGPGSPRTFIASTASTDLTASHRSTNSILPPATVAEARLSEQPPSVAGVEPSSVSKLIRNIKDTMQLLRSEEDPSQLVRQRLGSELKAHIEDLALFMSSFLIPAPAASAAADEKNGGGSPRRSTDLIGATYINLLQRPAPPDLRTSSSRSSYAPQQNSLQDRVPLVMEEVSVFFVVLSTHLCVLADDNWTGSAVSVEAGFSNPRSWPIENLEKVHVSFGFTMIRLDFGSGTEPPTLVAREPTLILRVLSHLQQAAASHCSERRVQVVVEPWPKCCPLKALCNRVPIDMLEDFVQKDIEREKQRKAGEEEERIRADDNLEGLERRQGDGAMVEGESAVEPIREDIHYAVYRKLEDVHVAGYFAVFWARHVPPSQPNAPGIQHSVQNSRIFQPENEGESSRYFGGTTSGYFPPQSSNVPWPAAPLEDSFQGYDNEKGHQVYPIRHLRHPHIRWEPVSFLLASNYPALFVVQEQTHQWPNQCDSEYATMHSIIPLKAITSIEVASPFSPFPLMVTLRIEYAWDRPAEKHMVVFQHPNTMSAFVRQLSASVERATQRKLMRSQVDIRPAPPALVGVPKESPAPQNQGLRAPAGLKGRQESIAPNSNGPNQHANKKATYLYQFADSFLSSKKVSAWDVTPQTTQAALDDFFLS